VKWKETFRPFVLPKRWHVLMLESGSEVNAASEKRKRKKKTNEEREKEKESE